MIATDQLNRLTSLFGDRLRYRVPLTRYTSARLGGPAEVLLEVHTKEELAEAVRLCWNERLPFQMLGGGSNVLVSDKGLSGIVLINRSRQVLFDVQSEPLCVWADSGINFGLLARQAASRGLSGLEWAAGIPGTLGGAVVGNAGAHGRDMQSSLILAEILHRIDLGMDASIQTEEWPVEKLEYSYRESILKRNPGQAVVLGASLILQHGDPEVIQKTMEDLVEFRHRTQPPGASMGSMFKNPKGDHAGRLIDAAGCKGFRIGDAQISPLHANFFINNGNATSSDIYELIHYAREKVADKFGIWLDLEIELVGDW